MLTPCPPGPEDRENRQFRAAAGTTTEPVTTRSPDGSSVRGHRCSADVSRARRQSSGCPARGTPPSSRARVLPTPPARPGGRRARIRRQVSARCSGPTRSARCALLAQLAPGCRRSRHGVEVGVAQPEQDRVAGRRRPSARARHPERHQQAEEGVRDGRRRPSRRSGAGCRPTKTFASCRSSCCSVAGTPPSASRAAELARTAAGRPRCGRGPPGVSPPARPSSMRLVVGEQVADQLGQAARAGRRGRRARASRAACGTRSQLQPRVAPEHRLPGLDETPNRRRRAASGRRRAAGSAAGRASTASGTSTLVRAPSRPARRTAPARAPDPGPTDFSHTAPPPHAAAGARWTTA